MAERMARSLAPVFSDYDELGEDERENLVHRYAGHTQGMTLADMRSIMRLAADRGLGLRDIEDAADLADLGPHRGEHGERHLSRGSCVQLAVGIQGASAGDGSLLLRGEPELGERELASCPPDLHGARGFPRLTSHDEPDGIDGDDAIASRRLRERHPGHGPCRERAADRADSRVQRTSDVRQVDVGHHCLDVQRPRRIDTTVRRRP